MVKMDETKTTGGTGRGVKIALILSLGLNLAVLGIVGGAIIAHGWRDDPRRVRDVGFGPYTEALSSEDRAELRKAFLKSAPDFRQRREEIRADMAALANAIRATPYDRAAVETVMETQSGRIEERLTLGRSLLLDRLDAMSPEARAAMADRLETVRRKHHD